MSAGNGDTVKIHYKGTLNDGEVFDSSEGREPLEFKIGEKRVIPGFEAGVMGMDVGDKKNINIPCAEAYGPRNPEMIMALPKTQFPPDINPTVGAQLQMQTNTGQTVMVIVTEVSETDVTLDANHPMAGKDLNFELELVSIN